MELKKTTIVEAVMNDGEPLKEGQTYIFSDGTHDLCGVFKGITARGTLKFAGVLPGHEDATFNILPKSIAAICPAEVLL